VRHQNQSSAELVGWLALYIRYNQSSAELVGWLALYIRYKSVYIQSIIIQMMRRLKMTLVAHHPGRCTICIRASGLTALTL
jgi:hypothetical protein